MFTQKMKTILGLSKLNPIIWLATFPPFQTVDQNVRFCLKITFFSRLNFFHSNRTFVNCYVNLAKDSYSLIQHIILAISVKY